MRRRASARAAATRLATASGWLPSAEMAEGVAGSPTGKTSGSKETSVPAAAVRLTSSGGVANVPSTVLAAPIRRSTSNQGLAVPAWCETASFSIRPVAVTGTFRVEELRGPDGKHLAIYALDGEDVQ